MIIAKSSGVYHLAQKSENLGWKLNGTVIFRKIRSESVHHLQQKSSFSVRNGTTEILCWYLVNFTRNRIANGKRHLVVRLFDDFNNMQPLSQLVHSDKWSPCERSLFFCFYLNGKHLSFTKRFRFSVFRSHPGDFKFLRFEERFRKFTFSWRISVDGRPNK